MRTSHVVTFAAFAAFAARRNQLVVVAAVIAAVARFGGCTCAQPKPQGKPQGAQCTKAADCAGNLVCAPQTQTCNTVQCTGDADCGTGAVCDATTSKCVANTPGGSCASDANCVNGEHCRGDKCFPQGSAGDSCTTTEQCNAPLVCDPSSSQCAATVACASNADCGNAAFCDVAAGTCSPASGSSSCSSDANCASGDKCVGVVCVPAQCQGEAFQAQPVKPNIMIVLDRSGSMEDALNNNDGPKIDVAKAAVKSLVSAHDADIRFGFTPFPSATQTCDGSENCAEPAVAIDVADNNGAAISTYVDGMTTCHGTPTGDAMHLFDGYTPLQDTTRPDFILLMTDGAKDCGNFDPPTEIATLAGGQSAQFPPVKTFVVGFGSAVDAQQLTDAANAGGEALPSTPNYYQADTAGSLDTIFSSIAQAALSCDYTLQGAGNDPNSLLVFFNGQAVPRDATHVTGWDYDPSTTQLTFAGNACVALQSGSVTDLTIAFGCPASGEGEGEGASAGEGEGQAGEGEGEGSCGGANAQCTQDSDCCAGFICDLQSHLCLFLGG